MSGTNTIVMTRLERCCDCIDGVVRPSYGSRYSLPAAEHACRLLGAGAVVKNEFVNLADGEEELLPGVGRAQLQEHDVLLTIRDSDLRAGVVPALEGRRYTATSAMVILRPQLAVLDSFLLAAYLNLPNTGQALLAQCSRGSLVPRLSCLELRKYEIPVLVDRARQTKLGKHFMLVAEIARNRRKQAKLLEELGDSIVHYELVKGGQVTEEAVRGLCGKEEAIELGGQDGL